MVTFRRQHSKWDQNMQLHRPPPPQSETTSIPSFLYESPSPASIKQGVDETFDEPFQWKAGSNAR